MRCGLLLLIMLFVSGCGKPAKAPPVRVRGVVKLDGQPLPKGEILFKIPGEVPTIAEIKEGVYELKVDIGKRHVEILAYRQAKDFNMGGVIIKGSMENYIPERFNVHTTLTAEVTAEGPNEFPFEVSIK